MAASSWAAPCCKSLLVCLSLLLLSLLLSLLLPPLATWATWDEASSACKTPQHRGAEHPPRGAEHPPRASSSSVSSSLYFSGRGRQQLKLRAARVVPGGGGGGLPAAAFTVEVWARPEGGQRSPAVIAGLFDDCLYGRHDKGWSLGIVHAKPAGTRPGGAAADARAPTRSRFYFSLSADNSRSATTLASPRRYVPDEWTHLAATYDGRRLNLFVNGAWVAGSRVPGRAGPLFAPGVAVCKTLVAGGDNARGGRAYRGLLSGLRLWRRALGSGEIRAWAERGVRSSGDGDAPAAEVAGGNDFGELEDGGWSTVEGGTYPSVRSVRASGAGTAAEPVPVPPPCGQTACDDVRVVSSYDGHWPLREPKLARYRLVNVYGAPGENPTVSREQVEEQHRVLNQAFQRYNISWELTVVDVVNASLRQRMILANCEHAKVGDGHCDPECSHPLTGYDGGDCQPPSGHHPSSSSSPPSSSSSSGHAADCDWDAMANGVCDPECNTAENAFDNGDCCEQTSGKVTETCFDPESPNRIYLDVEELQEMLMLDGSTHLNVYFANSAGEDLAGVATWPWDKNALTHLGGVVLNPTYYGKAGHTHTIIHELGHVLGLYHVFRGVSETESCDDPCRETTPSLETGDLCADTAPTPQNKLCHDPEPRNDTCGQRHFQHTPFNNYMGYGDDDCTDSFTPNQVARMHCYLDLVYEGWRLDRAPPPVPMPPIPVAQDEGSLTLQWMPPVNGHVFQREAGSACDLCGEDGRLAQFAHSASSPGAFNPSGHWSPKEAEGPPDVERPCESSLRSWSPELRSGQRRTPAARCPQPSGCVLELSFSLPSLPELLSIWVTYIFLHNSHPIKDLVILTADGRNESLGPQTVFCDVPLTVRLDWLLAPVESVRIHTADERLEVDAALLRSAPGDGRCSRCRPLSYKLSRSPPFHPHGHVAVDGPSRSFVDRSVEPGATYAYQVAVSTTYGDSQPSPPLVYTHGGPRCGGDAAAHGCTCNACSTCLQRLAAHGTARCDDEAGSRCEVLCGKGHRASEDGQQPAADGDPHQAGVTRVEGQGDERVARRPVDCGVPSWHLVYHAHFSYPHGTSYGARTTFVCLPPAKLQGASAELRCQEDGLWSLPEAYCQLTCRAPPPMANAVARTDRCKHDGQEVGSSCKYRCEPGHHVPLTSRKGFKVRCTDSGHWEEGGCVPVQCPPLPPVLHGSYTCTQRWQLGSRCWVNCSTASASKNHTVIRCSKNGRWSGELQLCPHEQGECTAPDPPFIITCDCPTGYGIGSVCKTSCLIPHSDSVLLPENVTVPEKITAPSLPHWWTLPTKVEEIVCTGKKMWHPPPRAIYCFQDCELWVGDGYCDPVNNNAYCHYDGGDCCVSTSAFKQVITVPASCDRKKECACRDPSAKENAQKRWATRPPLPP